MVVEVSLGMNKFKVVVLYLFNNYCPPTEFNLSPQSKMNGEISCWTWLGRSEKCMGVL